MNSIFKIGTIVDVVSGKTINKDDVKLVSFERVIDLFRPGIALDASGKEYYVYNGGTKGGYKIADNG